MIKSNNLKGSNSEKSNMCDKNRKFVAPKI